MIRHLVHLRFRADVDTATRQAIYDRLAALDAHIEGVLDFQHRRNVSVETPLVRGFEDLFWFDFRDLAVRDVYLADAEHQAIGAELVGLLDGGLDGVFVSDFAL